MRADTRTLLTRVRFQSRFASALISRERLPFVVVEGNRRRVAALRSILAVYGDATAVGVLEAARVDRARLPERGFSPS